MEACILGIPQGDFHLEDGVVYALLDEGGITSAALSLSEMAKERGFDIAVVTWRPGERGIIGRTLNELALAGYEGTIGIVPAVPPGSEYELLAMLLDIGDEVSSVSEYAFVLVLGLDAIPLKRRVVISALITCGFVPLSCKVSSIDGAGEELDGPTRAMATFAISGAPLHLEKGATEAMVEKFVGFGSAGRHVGF